MFSAATPFGPVSAWANVSADPATMVRARWEDCAGHVRGCAHVFGFIISGAHTRRVDAQMRIGRLELAVQFPSLRFVRTVLRARRMAALKGKS